MKRLLLTAGIILTVQLTVRAQFAPCLGNQPFKIVVLGSSTAAGTGPSHPDSAWVNKYRKYLKSINPLNEVTNLARGGTTTYHIMPTGFAPANPGRPNEDTIRNITKAISLNPDGIIVNMPSNDASNGFGPAEQLYNFDSLVSEATLAGIPIWICTTQPRNGLSATATQWQSDVKDSILLKYGNQAINFWDTFATATGTLKTAYNAGDGIHMNNAGHQLLFERVRDKNILLALYQASGTPDYEVYSIQPGNFNVCGDSSMNFPVILTNGGANDNSDVVVHFERKYLVSTQVEAFTDTLHGGLATCQTDTVNFSATTYLQGDYQIRAWLETVTTDTNKVNDTLTGDINILGHPDIHFTDDTACKGDILVLNAAVSPGDTLFWYDQQSGGSIIQSGNSLITPLLDSTLTYYVSAVRGPLFYSDSLTTTYSSNNDWNGMMIDVIAHDDLVLDSLAMKVFTLGKQPVDIYTKTGSYKGHEANAASWSVYTTDTVNINSAREIAYVDLDSLVLNANDTLGIYIKMQSHLGKISYLVVPSEVSRSTGELEVLTGTAVTHNWGASYFPRDWNGTLYYHFGFNPQGTCHTTPAPIHAFMEEPAPDLGPDTSFQEKDSILLSAGKFDTYLWSTGDTTASVWLKGKDLGIGTHIIAVDVIGKFGCMGGDTIEITVDSTDFTGITQFKETQIIRLYPNPAKSSFTISAHKSLGGNELIITDITGKSVLVKNIDPSYRENSLQIELPHCEPGIYTITLKGKDASGRAQLLLLK